MKSNKNAANLAFAAAAALIGGVVTINVDPAIDTSKAEIFAPAVVEAGALTIFSTQGTDVNWEIHPDIPSQAFGENQSSLATSFQKVGNYLVIASYLDQNGEVQLRTHEVVAERPGPTPAPPLPDQPDAPEPDEDISVLVIPEPDPVPDNYPNTAFPEVRAEIESICNETQIEPARACELAKNFTKVAERIESGELKTVAGVLRETQVANRPVIRVSKATTKIQLVVSQKRFDGELGDVAAYADLWHEIASGLATYGNCK